VDRSSVEWHLSTELPSITSKRNINPLNAELNPICHLLALLGGATIVVVGRLRVNTLNAELNPICHLLALLGGATIVAVSRLRVNFHCYNAQINCLLFRRKFFERRCFFNL
jgi:hypothetical protein